MLGRTFAEAFHLDDIAADADRVRVELSPEVKAIFSCGTGCVLASLHMGNWEVAALAAARSGLQIAGVYQRLKNPLVDRAVTRMRRALLSAAACSARATTPSSSSCASCAAADASPCSPISRDMGASTLPSSGGLRPRPPSPPCWRAAMGVPLVAGRVLRPTAHVSVLTAEIVPVPHTADRDADVRQATAAHPRRLRALDPGSSGPVDVGPPALGLSTPSPAVECCRLADCRARSSSHSASQYALQHADRRRP